MSLRINDGAADFEADTTQGRIRFHEWIDSLQLLAKHKVATPANWQPGEDVIIAGAVSDEEARNIYPQGCKASLPYLRLVPDPTASATSWDGAAKDPCVIPCSPARRS